MRDPPMALARLGVAQGCGCDGGGGTGRREPAGVRRISHGSGLIVLLSSATGVGGQRSAHQGSRTSSDDVLGGRRRGPAAEVGLSSRRSRCRASPGSWIRRGSVGSCCGDVPKVRKVQGSLKTRDFGGAGTHRRCCARGILVLQSSEPGKKCAGGLRGARRSFCVGSGGLRGGGAVSARRRGALLRAEARRRR